MGVKKDDHGFFSSALFSWKVGEIEASQITGRFGSMIHVLFFIVIFCACLCSDVSVCAKN